MVYRDELAFVVPPTHPLAGSAEVSIKQLGAEYFVAHHVPSPLRAKVLETFQKRKVPLHMDVEMPTIEAIKKFVAMGNGVALIPAICVEGEIARGELVHIPVPEVAAGTQVAACVSEECEPVACGTCVPERSRGVCRARRRTVYVCAGQVIRLSVLQSFSSQINAWPHPALLLRWVGSWLSL